eukprot:Pompholyxophrys_punicea_v1_NODE_2045_length_473_cov_1.483254.p2 type:complete len:124 gc:universal NODE_2045_length_473_cov_1.483254:433-62(-)
MSNRSSGRFVDDPNNVQSSNCPCIFCGLTLGVIKISWNCHNCIFHGFSQIIFCNFFHFLKNHRRNLLREKQCFFSFDFNLNSRTTIFVNNFKWPVFDVILNVLIRKFTANHSFHIINSPKRIH